jgi:hypothetical protein
MTKELAARRLSGALARKVTAEEIVFMTGDLVHLTDGSVYALEPGNTAYKGGAGVRFRNGRFG